MDFFHNILNLETISFNYYYSEGSMDIYQVALHLLTQNKNV